MCRFINRNINNEKASIFRLSSPKQGFVRNKFYRLGFGDLQTLLQERRCNSQYLLEEVWDYNDNIFEEVVQAVPVRMEQKQTFIQHPLASCELELHED